MNIKRCAWSETNELFIPYHDQEWGAPVHDDRQLFEMLNLEGAQAGLSWLTVLKKRDHYRKVFDNFEPEKIIAYDDTKLAALLVDPGIIRNRLKINAVVRNANAYFKVVDEYGDFDTYIWQFVHGKPLKHTQAPQAVEISKGMSKALQKQGFTFVGPTICYAFMQAVGMINDHESYCFRANQIG